MGDRAKEKLDEMIEREGHAAGAPKQMIDDVKTAGEMLLKRGIPPEELAETAGEQFKSDPRKYHEGVERQKAVEHIVEEIRGDDPSDTGSDGDDGDDGEML